MRSPLAFLFSLALLSLPLHSSFAAARTVTWLQSGGGNLQAASNWDSGAVPGPEDDVVIKLAQLDASSSPHSPARSSRRRSDPWESDSASSRGDLGGGAMLTLMQGWSVRSLSVSGGSASLVADTQLQASGAIVVGRGAQVLVKGGTIEAARIDVTEGGTLSLDLGTVGNAQSRGGDPLQLRVQNGGTLLCSSGGGGSSNFAHSAITLSSGGQLLWDAGPLILDSSTLAIDSGATLFAKAEILTQGDASASSATRINNAGRIVFDSTELGSTASQMLGVPLSNTGTIVLTGPLGQPADLRVLNELKHEGLLSLTGSRTLSLSYSAAEFGRNSRTEIDANATLLCQSGEAKFAGKIAAKAGVTEGGEMVVSALATQSGSVDVIRIVMRGGTLDTAAGSVTTTKQLQWLSGSLGGEGSLSVGHASTNEGQLTLEDPSGSKVLVGPTLHLYGSAWIRPSNTLLMQKSAAIHVGPSSVLTHEEGSQLQSGDNSAVSLLLDLGSRWIFETDQSSSYTSSALTNSSSSAADGDEALSSRRRGSRIQTVVSVPLSSQADLVVRGSGEAVFRRDARFTGLRSEDDRSGVGVRFQGLSNSTAFVFTHPISMPGVDQYLLLQSASLELQSHTKSALRNLVLLDGSLALLQADVAAGIEVQDTMVLGSPSSSSKIAGKGPVKVRSMRLLAGKVEVEKVDVSGELVISSNGAKELNLRNLTLLSGSSSRIGPSQTRVGDALHWSLQSNASLVIEGGAQLHASRPADASGQPCLRVEGIVRWIGLAGERASSSLEIVNLAQMEVVNRAFVDRNGTDLAAAVATSESVPAYAPEEAFEAALSGGLKSVSSSRLQLHAASALLSSCPQNLTDVAGCTFGDVSGAMGGRLHLLVGRHTLLSPVNVSFLSVENGENSFRRQVVADKIEIKQGGVELLGYAFVNLLLIHGGRLLGYPVLSSALVVLPAPRGRALLSHNTTLMLSGLSLICRGDCEARGVDWVLSSSASVVVAPGGSLKFTTGATMHSGVGGGGELRNAGSMEFAAVGTGSGGGTDSTKIVLRVPVVNRGSMLLQASCSLDLLSRMTQDAPAASLQLSRGSVLTMVDSGFLELDAGILQSEGTIHAHVQIGGRIVRADGAAATLINGDVVLAPAAVVLAHCSSTVCSPALSSNGTVWLNGLAHFRFDDSGVSGGRSVEVMQARQVVGSFRDTISGVEAGAASYEMQYAPASVFAVLSGASSSSKPIPSFYAQSLGTDSTLPRTAIVAPLLAPEPASAEALASLGLGYGERSVGDMMDHSLRKATEAASQAAAAAAEDADRRTHERPPPAPVPPPAVQPAPLSRSSLGLSPRASDALHILFWILAALLTIALGALLFYSRQLREQLENLRAQAAAQEAAAVVRVSSPKAAACAATATGSAASTSSTTTTTVVSTLAVPALLHRSSPQPPASSASPGLNPGGAASSRSSRSSASRTSPPSLRRKRGALNRSEEGMEEGREGVPHAQIPSHL